MRPVSGRVPRPLPLRRTHENSRRARRHHRCRRRRCGHFRPGRRQADRAARFTNEFTDGPYDCDGLVTAIDVGSFEVNVVGNLRGSSPFPFYVENVNGTVVTTNLDTGGTYTQVFADSGRDHTIVDNGDGTITVTQHGQGVVRFYDQFGNFVLKDPGAVWVSFDARLQRHPLRSQRRRRRAGLLPDRAPVHR